MWTWLARAPTVAGDLGSLVASLEGLAVLRRDLDARLASHGVGSVAQASALGERLVTVLAGIDAEELERARATVAKLEGRLRLLTDRLDALREIQRHSGDP